MRRMIAAAAVLLVQPLLVAAQAGPPRPAGRESNQLLETIQYECLRAWSADLIYDATGTEELPAKTQGVGAAQEEFLTEVVTTDEGRFYPSALEDLRDALEYYIEPGTRFLDLGSGDGRVVFYANALGADATGYESDRRLLETSHRAQVALGQKLAADRLRLVEKDFYTVSWSEYDVIFYYDLGTDDPLKLRQKIFAELAPGAVFLVAHPQLPFPGLVPEYGFKVVTSYRQPEMLGAETPALVEAVRKEVLSLHRFLENWYNGKVENSDRQLERFAGVLAPGFQAIVPGGTVKNPGIAVDALHRGHGLWRGTDGKLGKLRIENLEVRFRTSAAVVVSYDEWHEFHGSRRGFRSTAVLQLHWGQAGVEWLHIHRSPVAP